MSEKLKDYVLTENADYDKSLLLWVHQKQELVYFSPREGFEAKAFHSQEDLMEYVKACVSAGYCIG